MDHSNTALARADCLKVVVHHNCGGGHYGCVAHHACVGVLQAASDKLIFSRGYSEMWLAHLAAAGRAVKEAIA